MDPGAILNCVCLGACANLSSSASFLKPRAPRSWFFRGGIHSSSPGLMEHPDSSRSEDGGSHGHLPDLRVWATHPSPEKWRRMGRPDSFGSARVGNPPRNHSPMKFWKGKTGQETTPCHVPDQMHTCWVLATGPHYS